MRTRVVWECWGKWRQARNTVEGERGRDNACIYSLKNLVQLDDIGMGGQALQSLDFTQAVDLQRDEGVEGEEKKKKTDMAIIQSVDAHSPIKLWGPLVRGRKSRRRHTLGSL